jgi:transketolase C-terminal domain/subunit
MLAVGAAAAPLASGEADLQSVIADGSHARRVEVLRTELVDRLGGVLLAERDALAVEAGLTAFGGAELAILRAADAVERALP